MANHVRRQIRDAVKTLLTGLTTTGSNVYSSRVWPMRSAVMPGLIIYTAEEESELGSIGTLDRVVALAVEGYVNDTSSLNDILDQICSEVETAMAADVMIGGLAKNSLITQTEIRLDGEGKKTVGVVTMTFNIFYRTSQSEK